MTWVWHQMFSLSPWDRSTGAGQTILTTPGTMGLLINTEGRVWEISTSVLKSVWAQNLKSICCQSKRLKHGKFREFKVTFNRYSSALHIKFLGILALFFLQFVVISHWNEYWTKYMKCVVMGTQLKNSEIPTEGAFSVSELAAFQPARMASHSS